MNSLPSGVSRRRAIHALLLREAKARYPRLRMGYAWAIIEPALQVGIMTGLAYASGRGQISGIDAAPFIASGLAVQMIFSRVAVRAAGAVEANRVLLSYPGLQPTDTILARSLLETATVIAVALLGLVLFSACGFTIPAEQPLLVLASFFGAALLGLSIGTITAAAIPWLPGAEGILRTSSRLIYLCSGVFYGFTTLPAPVAEVLAWNPLLHYAEWMRLGLFPAYQSPACDPAYALTCTALLTFIALGAARYSDQAGSGWRVLQV